MARASASRNHARSVDDDLVLGLRGHPAIARGVGSLSHCRRMADDRCSTGLCVGALISGFLNLSDIIPPKHVILGGTLGAAAANGLVELAGVASVGIALRFATGFFLAGVYPPALKLMATWFQRDRGVALGILVGAIVLGQAMPHLINGLGGLDWRVVIYMTSALTLAGGLITEFAVRECKHQHKRPPRFFGLIHC